MQCSKAHVGEDVLAGDDAFELASAWVGDGQRTQMHVAEDVEDFLQTVRALREVGRVDDVRADVDDLVHVVFADVLNLAEVAVMRVVVDVEEAPVQNLVRDRDLSLILRKGKTTKHFFALFDLAQCVLLLFICVRRGELKTSVCRRINLFDFFIFCVF